MYSTVDKNQDETLGIPTLPYVIPVVSNGIRCEVAEKGYEKVTRPRKILNARTGTYWWADAVENIPTYNKVEEYRAMARLNKQYSRVRGLIEGCEFRLRRPIWIAGERSSLLACHHLQAFTTVPNSSLPPFILVVDAWALIVVLGA